MIVITIKFSYVNYQNVLKGMYYILGHWVFSTVFTVRCLQIFCDLQEIPSHVKNKVSEEGRIYLI